MPMREWCSQKAPQVRIGAEPERLQVVAPATNTKAGAVSRLLLSPIVGIFPGGNLRYPQDFPGPWGDGQALAVTTPAALAAAARSVRAMAGASETAKPGVTRSARLFAVEITLSFVSSARRQRALTHESQGRLLGA